MNNPHEIRPFYFVLLGMLMQCIPVDSFCYPLLSAIGGLFVIAGLLLMAKKSKGLEQLGAIFLLLAEGLSIVLYSKDLLDILTGIPDMLALPSLYYNFESSNYSFVEEYQLFISLSLSALSIIGFSLWLASSSLRKIRVGIIVLIVAEAIMNMYFLVYYYGFTLYSFTAASVALYYIGNLLLVIGWFLIVRSFLFENARNKQYTIPLLLCAIGFLGSLFAIIDGGLELVIYSMLSIFVWFIGIVKLSFTIKSKVVVYTFKLFALSMTIALCCDLIPTMQYDLSLPVIFLSYLIVAVGFFKLRTQMDRIKSLRTLGILCIFSVAVGLMPLVHESGIILSSLIFCLLILPVALYTWVYALTNVVVTEVT